VPQDRGIFTVRRTVSEFEAICSKTQFKDFILKAFSKADCFPEEKN